MALNPKYSDTMVNAQANAVGNALELGLSPHLQRHPARDR